MNHRSSFIARAAIVVAALVFAAGLGMHYARAESSPEDLKGKSAPDFSLQTLNDKNVKLSELKGNVVVVDFWATWCPPCRLSLPHIQRLSQDKDLHKQGLRILAVNAREGKDKIEPFMDKNKYTFDVPMDSSGSAMQAYGVEGIPTTVVVGRDGSVKAVFVGFNPKEGGKGVDEAVESALKEK
ncbi:MAG TPA: TlpA disulfide reductase family protein [Tepidisphaeraceae bacterium]|jgi:thiol-disulfide isomerase/thioredoxin|nr:TlpA disulfide reductase family protein [Tepidisphaeraceae bacterium]